MPSRPVAPFASPMSEHAPKDYSHHFGAVQPVSSDRGPHNVTSSARDTHYSSSLNDALGTSRPSGYIYSGGGRSDYQPVIPPHMNPDNRYSYSQPSGMASAYEYQSYSGSYDAQGQYSLPPLRSGASQSPPAPTSTSHYAATHQPPYQQSYSQSQYGVQHQPQWSTTDSWGPPQHYSPPQPEPVYVAGHGAPGSPADDPRPYVAPPQYSPPVPSHRQVEDRHPVSPDAQMASKGKERERHSAPQDRAPRNDVTQQAIDFQKLLDSYRNVMNGCSTILGDPYTAQGGPPTLATLDRMLQSAQLARDMLQQSAHPTTLDRRPSNDNSADGSHESVDSPPVQVKKQVEAPTSPEGQTCLGCGATSTPEWRRGPLGPRTLCNACGLVYAKLIKKRSREVGSNVLPSSKPPPPSYSHNRSADDKHAMSGGEGASDDERSIGSPDRRSDGGKYSQRD